MSTEARRRSNREYSRRVRAEAKRPKGHKVNPRTYDAEDYCKEMELMALEGTPTKAFITRSNPTPQWFRRNVRPIAQVALCGSCYKYFNPQHTGSLVECEKPRCRLSLDRRNA